MHTRQRQELDRPRPSRIEEEDISIRSYTNEKGKQEWKKRKELQNEKLLNEQ